jgi:ATP-dependent Clp protease ATP-binding subunit ClpB
MGARRMSLRLTDAAKSALAKAGFDPDYGARPLKRALQREVIDPLARKILAGDVRDGDAVEVDAAKDGSFQFRPAGRK